MAGTGTRRAVALVIGVGNYPDPKIRPLRYAATDASAVVATLRDPDLCRFPPDQVIELINANATRSAITKHLSVWMKSAAAGAELVFLYFAGHGVMAPVGGQLHGFFLPHDADPENPVGSGVDLALVATCTKDLSAATVVLCLDCCHAGAAGPRGQNDQEVGRGLGIQPAILRPLFGGRQGRYVWTACDESQSSYEVQEFGKGLFTHYLLSEVETADTRGVELDSLFNVTAARVSQYATQIGVMQTPVKFVTSSGQVFLVEPNEDGPPKDNTRTNDHSGTINDPIKVAERVEAVRLIVQRLATADAAERERLLRRLARLAKDPAPDEVVQAAIPAVFAHLADPAESVQKQALGAFQAIGVRRSFDTLVAVAGYPSPPKFGPILKGLLTLKAEPDLVAVLDRLTDDLTGEELLQAHEVLERKRQSLGLEELAKLFRQKGSQYQPVDSLGTGLFALAYRAEHRVSKHPFVIRVLRPEFARSPDIRKQFLDLAKRAIGINHSNLVKAVDVDRLEGRDVYYAVRGLVDGVTLKNMLDGDHQFSPAEVVAVLRQVLSVLIELHENGLSHGGVKPSNVFRGKRGRITLGDLTPTPQGFGQEMAKRLAYDFRYIAPEVSPAAPGGLAADIYAVGCLAFELLTGKPPFVGNDHYELISQHRREQIPTARTARGNLGAAANDFLRQLLAKSPTARPDAETALSNLEAILDPPAATSRTAPPPPPVRPASLIGHTVDRYRPLVSVMSIGKSAKNNDFNSVDNIDLSVLSPPTRQPSSSQNIDHTNIRISGGGLDPTWDTTPPANNSVRPESHYYPFLTPSDRPGELGHLGPYRIVKLLGMGGMGFVFLAEDEGLQRRVALKVVRPEVAVEPTARERFLREGRAAAAIKSDHVITIYQVSEANGVLFLAMEYLEGMNLEDWLRAWQERGQGPVPAKVVIRVAKDMLQGLAAAHKRGLVHRDIKPANLWIEAGTNRVKILDFGLTRDGGAATELTRTGQVLGTVTYMAPEQARGLKVDGRADLFSAGVVLHCMLGGQSPFKRETYNATMIAVAMDEAPSAASFGVLPAELAELIDRMLSKSPDSRPASAEEALEVVMRVQHQLREG